MTCLKAIMQNLHVSFQELDREEMAGTDRRTMARSHRTCRQKVRYASDATKIITSLNKGRSKHQTLSKYTNNKQKISVEY